MNILIIGNGFDLAHKLPTTYKNFLDFIEQVIRMKTFSGTFYAFEYEKGSENYHNLDDAVKEYFRKKFKDSTDKGVNETAKNDEYLNELIELSDNNIWIEWFSKAIIKQGWIDFEAEISNVVQRVEELLCTNINNEDTFIIDETKLGKNDYEILSIVLKDHDTTCLGSDIKNIKNRMLNDLNRLIRCLEIYLEDCVRNIDKKLLSLDIYDLKVDKVISFNYTDTYYRFYSAKHNSVECDYLHGKSNLSKAEPNNMVLGIDEYLSDTDKFTKLDFVEFKKYFQRIHKSTSCLYRKWLDEINDKKEENQAYFFGHSLSLTDKDVVSSVLLNEYIRTTIYYRNEEQYAELIANIVRIIGPEELTEKVYGAEPSIIFKKQKALINRTQSEWQIFYDRYLLWRIYTLNNKKINELIERIKKNIEMKNIVYFYNQRCVIDLFDAIINNIDIGDVSDQLLAIANALYDPNSYEEFSWQEWNSVNYYGIVECDKRVKRFINTINNYNEGRKLYSIKSISDDLNVLYNQINHDSYNDKEIKEIFDNLLDKFNDESMDTYLIWKCIYKLLQKMSEDSREELLQRKSYATDNIMKIRIKHIVDVLEEEKYMKHIEYSKNN